MYAYNVFLTKGCFWMLDKQVLCAVCKNYIEEDTDEAEWNFARLKAQKRAINTRLKLL